MSLEGAGYFKSLNRLSRETVDQLLATLRQRHLRIEPIPSEVLSKSSLGPKVTEELTRLPVYLARGVRSWNGLVVCFPGNRKELAAAFVGTPYLRKFRLLDLVIPHVIVLTGDIYKSMKGAALPLVPKTKSEAWVQAMLCREMAAPHGLAVPLLGVQTRLGFIAPELPTGEGTKHPERLDILAYDKSDHSLVAVEIKGPKASRVEIENLFLQGLEHRNWLEYNKMAVKLMFDGVRGRRINTRKRVRLLLASLEDRVPPLFRDLRDEAIRKDRHLSIELGRLIIRENGGLKMAPFLSDSIERVRVTG